MVQKRFYKLFTNWQGYLQWLPKIEICFRVLEGQHVLIYLTEATLHDVIDNVNFNHKY